MTPILRLTFFFLLFTGLQAKSQCAFTINTFPYSEDFETTTGGWMSGGIGNDWAWGSPNKSYIQTAGSGLKCWVTGGLNGSSYSNGARSYVESPCFDFTSLQNPVIEFQLYWECENIYDGAAFQYSTNNGVTWQTLGSNTDGTNCMNQGWYNTSTIINLSTLTSGSLYGWAGSVSATSGSCQGGGGSNGWVKAKHCLTGLGGNPSVRFRMVFGAGTTCNAYDGVAFDAIRIEDAPSNDANFNFSCGATIRQYNFTNSSTPCPNSYLWNFGDPASGALNGSGEENPAHVFSAPGTYTVSLTVNGPCNGSSTISKTITIPILETTISNPLCKQPELGQIQAIMLYALPPVNYLLQPTGDVNTTGQFNGLTAGSYTVIATDAIGCSVTAILQLQSADAPAVQSQTILDVTCHDAGNGQISISATGSTPLLRYQISPGGTTNYTGLFSGLAAGQYQITISDAENCSSSIVLVVNQPEQLQITNTTYEPGNCPNLVSGKFIIDVRGGTQPYFYAMNNSVNYQPENVFFDIPSGSYVFKVMDQQQCLVSKTILIPEKVCCEDIFVPNAFSPNRDGRNDEFGLKGIAGIELIDFLIFDRWGTLIFSGQHLGDSWNGRFKGGDCDLGSYYYSLRYRCGSNGNVYHKKGDVLLIR
jgi:gliding motility-associated-like protein